MAGSALAILAILCRFVVSHVMTGAIAAPCLPLAQSSPRSAFVRDICSELLRPERCLAGSDYKLRSDGSTLSAE